MAGTALSRGCPAPVAAIGHNDRVATGKRAGSRRGERAPRKFNPIVLAYAAAITVCMIAWGYLVFAAIDFGTAARGGDGTSAWALMSLAALGAMACLFLGLMLVSWLLRSLGITTAPEEPDEDPAPPPPRVPGGKRAAR